MIGGSLVEELVSSGNVSEGGMTLWQESQSTFRRPES